MHARRLAGCARAMPQLACGGAGAQRVCASALRCWHNSPRAHHDGVASRHEVLTAASAATQLQAQPLVPRAAAASRGAALRAVLMRPQARKLSHRLHHHRAPSAAAAATAREPPPPPEDAAPPETEALPACFNLERAILLAGFAFEARVRPVVIMHAPPVTDVCIVMFTHRCLLSAAARRRTRTRRRTACATWTRAAAPRRTRRASRRSASQACCA
jgi:hypothetical protein